MLSVANSYRCICVSNICGCRYVFQCRRYVNNPYVFTCYLYQCSMSFLNSISPIFLSRCIKVNMSGKASNICCCRHTSHQQHCFLRLKPLQHLKVINANQTVRNPASRTDVNLRKPAVRTALNSYIQVRQKQNIAPHQRANTQRIKLFLS